MAKDYYAKVRSPEMSWADLGVLDLEGNPFPADELPEVVTALCVDTSLGVYVLTADGERYFTCNSIELEFI
jgi:hypothetical protein